MSYDCSMVFHIIFSRALVSENQLSFNAPRSHENTKNQKLLKAIGEMLYLKESTLQTFSSNNVPHNRLAIESESRNDRSVPVNEKKRQPTVNQSTILTRSAVRSMRPCTRSQTKVFSVNS